ARGGVAAATSTGGLAGKRRGRVGDSAGIGAGTYADDRIGAGSAPRPRGANIRLGPAPGAPAPLRAAGRAPLDPPAALAAPPARLGASAGLILTDARGRIGVAHTTPSMPVAIRRTGATRALLVD